MKALKIVCLVTAMAQAAVPVVQAAPASADLVANAFGTASTAPAGVDLLSDEALAETRGKLAPLVLVTAIAGLDLALMGVFWGVYVPNYGGGGHCSTCTSRGISSH